MNLKRIITLLCILVFSFSAVAQYVNNLEKFIQGNNLQPDSPITSISISDSDIYTSFGEISTTPDLLRLITSFDQNGNTKELTSFNVNEVGVPLIAIKSVFKYDEQNNQKEHASYSGDGRLISVGKFFQSLEGIYSEQLVYDSSGAFMSSHMYKHDEDGNLIEDTLYGLDDLLVSITTYKYDKSGNRVESSYDLKSPTSNVAGSNSTMTKTGQNYILEIKPNTQQFSDPNINQAKSSSIANEPKFLAEKTIMECQELLNHTPTTEPLTITLINYLYDNNNNIVKEVHFSEEQMLTETEFEYDLDGNRTKMSYNDVVNKDLSFTLEENYDDNRNLIESFKYDVNGEPESILRCTYEDFDPYLNWRKRTCIRYAEIFGELQPDYNTLVNEIRTRQIFYRDTFENDKFFGN